MIERVLEHWLDNSSERTYQIPFCHMLGAEGYTVLHMSRHCGIEMGKDIIAIDPEGNLCAFQLKGVKGKKIHLRQWRDELSKQVDDLMNLKIIHPSINSSKQHRSILVTNGEFDEEVSRAIDDLNRMWMDRGHPENRLETIVRGQLLEKAKNLGSNLWPSQLTEIKNFLELILLNGKGGLPKEKFASLFTSILFLHNNVDPSPSKAQCIRNISSGALLCSSAISSFLNEKNYYAEIEAWVIYISYVFACSERWNLKWREIQGSIELAISTIYNSLDLLCEEIMERNNLVEGDALVDQPVYRVRLTLLLSLMSVFALWRDLKKEPKSDKDTFINSFIKEKHSQLLCWGEAAIPQFLAVFWHWKTFNPSPEPDFLIGSLLKIIIEMNTGRSEQPIADPYFDEEKILPHLLGTNTDELEEEFKGSSYTAEGLMHLFVRRMWKTNMKLLWPGITRLGFNSFFPKEKWQYYMWRSELGLNIDYHSPLTKDWADLRKEASEKEGVDIPELLKREHVFFILFLIVYPHRFRSDAVRWLDSKIRNF